jgi:hypothetical protein
MVRFLSLYNLPCLIIALLLFSCKENISSPHQQLRVTELEAAFDEYKEPSLTHRRFKHADILPLIKKRHADFRVEEIGKSIQEREIFQLTYGSGSSKVLLWSQMHGNESTATMAVFDLFNFLEGKDDKYDAIRNLLQDQLEIRFIPMVNPDGAEVFQRRNVLDIDINRDAIHETTPEAAMLKMARESFQPVFGFNLHDQQIYYNTTGSPNPATISLLAPAYNEETEVNEVREKSMRLIVGMNNLLQQVVPGHVGKYDDSFEPRAFGDNFQKWGTSTILIESGGYPNDPEKQFIRKLNFMIILNALYEIATTSYAQYELEDYYAIPDNDSKLMDLIIRKVGIEQGGNNYQVDLGIKRREIEADSGYHVSGTIEEKGDLSVFYGYHEINEEGLQFKTGNIWKGTYNSFKDISEEKAIELLRQGYLAIKVANVDQKVHHLPLVVVKEEKAFKSGHQLGNAANFFLQKDGEILYAVVNGYVIDLKNPMPFDGKQKIF